MALCEVKLDHLMVPYDPPSLFLLENVQAKSTSASVPPSWAVPQSLENYSAGVEMSTKAILKHLSVDV